MDYLFDTNVTAEDEVNFWREDEMSEIVSADESRDVTGYAAPW